MTFLVLGVLLFIAVHFIPSLGRPLKLKLIGAVGENGYKGLFSLAVVGAIALIVLGWRSADPTPVYAPPLTNHAVVGILMLIAFFLIGAGNHPSRIKRLLRHPMLTGVALWAAVHLLVNGDSRSLVLFGGLCLWALIEMPLINAREGAWEKPPAPSIAVEVRGVIIAVILLAVLIWAHRWFTGVALIP